MRGLDRLIAEQTGLPGHVAEDPLSAVAEGAGVVLLEGQLIENLHVEEARRVLSLAEMIEALEAELSV